MPAEKALSPSAYIFHGLRTQSRSREESHGQEAEPPPVRLKAIAVGAFKRRPRPTCCGGFGPALKIVEECWETNKISKTRPHQNIMRFGNGSELMHQYTCHWDGAHR